MKRTRNFINITKSLAESYQSDICLKKKMCEIEVKKSIRVYDVKTKENYEDYMDKIAFFEQDGKLRALQFLTYESFDYRTGLLIKMKFSK